VNRAVVATVALAAMWAGLASAETGKPASFFVEGKPNPTLLAAVRNGTSQKITFNGHFSSADVSCGPGCDSYWFVDRQTGGVVEVPESSADDQMIWDVHAQPTSDTIAVTFGPRDGVAGKCVARHFRLTGKSFVAVDKPSSAKCPS
jgi:hypothetical protein